MGFILFILTIIIPRLLGFFILLFTNWWGLAYKSILIPLILWVFLPRLSLVYLAAMLTNNGNCGGGWLVLAIIAFLLDISVISYHISLNK